MTGSVESSLSANRMVVSEMARICIVTTAPSTIRAFVLPTISRLTREGHDVCIVCDEDAVLRSQLAGLCKYRSVAMRRGVDLRGISAVFALRRVFKAENCSVVQYATPNASLYASIAAWSLGVPVRLYAQWGMRYVGFEGWRRGVFRFLERLVCLLSTDVWVASPMNLVFGVEQGLYTRDKARVIGAGGTIGVDLVQFETSQWSTYGREVRERYALRDSFVFGFVGRLATDKGIAELLEAMSRICQTEDVRLLCIGTDEGASEYVGGLGREMQDRVVFTGHLSHSEAVKLYAAMDCYVHPSHREGFGMAIQEAAAMGRPIVTTDIPGASEVMEPGVSCLVVEPRNAEALEAAMRAVMTDASLRHTLGHEARRRVELLFERQGMLDRQYAAYRELLGRLGQS